MPQDIVSTDADAERIRDELSYLGLGPTVLPQAHAALKEHPRRDSPLDDALNHLNSQKVLDSPKQEMLNTRGCRTRLRARSENQFGAQPTSGLVSTPDRGTITRLLPTPIRSVPD